MAPAIKPLIQFENCSPCDVKLLHDQWVHGVYYEDEHGDYTVILDRFDLSQEVITQNFRDFDVHREFWTKVIMWFPRNSADIRIPSNQ